MNLRSEMYVQQRYMNTHTRAHTHVWWLRWECEQQLVVRTCLRSVVRTHPVHKRRVVKKKKPRWYIWHASSHAVTIKDWPLTAITPHLRCFTLEETFADLWHAQWPFELLSTLVLGVLSTVTSAAVGTTLRRAPLGRGKRTLATSLSHNNRLIIVFVSNKSDTTDCMSLSCFEHLNYLPPTPPPHSLLPLLLLLFSI